MSIFSQNMKKARRKKNWSQKGAATEIGITRAAIASYETGRTEPSYTIFNQICKVYDIGDWKSFLTDKHFFKKKRPTL